MKKQIGKLRLTRETLQALENEDLSTRVPGAGVSPPFTVTTFGCATPYCKTACHCVP